MHTGDVTDRMPYLTGIPPNVIFSGIEGIWHGKEALMYDVVSKMIRKLNGRQIVKDRGRDKN